MKKWILLIFMVCIFMGCMVEKNEESSLTGNEKILNAIRELAKDDNIKRENSTNGLRGGVYMLYEGEYFFYSFEDTFLLTNDEVIMYFELWNACDDEGSYLVNNNNAISILETKDTIFTDGSLRSKLEDSTINVTDSEFALNPQTIILRGRTIVGTDLNSANLECSDGRVIKEIFVQEIWETAEIKSDLGEWYSFEVKSGKTYELYWDDKLEGSGTYSLDVKVSAYMSDKTNSYFIDKDLSYSEPSLITVSEDGYIYLLIKPSSLGEIGDFGLKIVEHEIGAFKIANSWGKGSWENISDGFLYMTYKAMKKNSINTFLMEYKDNYTPKAVAVFNVSSENRGGNDLFISINNPNPSIASKVKKFNSEYISNGGNLLFPENNMVMDITELLPISSEDVIYFGSSENSSTDGTINSFEIRIYDNEYVYEDPSTLMTATNIPLVYTAGNLTVLEVESIINAGFEIAGKTGGFSLFNLSKTMEVEDIPVKNNLIIDKKVNTQYLDFGRGLANPSQEEWLEMITENNIRVIDSKKVLEYIGSSSQPVDNSSSIYFPPIGNQGQENSCVSWSCGYYTATFYEARDNGWDLSGATFDSNGVSEDYKPYIMNPDFIYHQINNGVDAGSYYYDNAKIISHTGISSWKTSDWSDTDYTSWPSEEAWAEAANYRCDIEKSYTYWLEVDDDDGIEALKALISNGYLITIAIEANNYSNMTENDVWNTGNYNTKDTNHANTIVGYNDTKK